MTLWTLALSYVSGPVKVRIACDASNQWTCGTETCSAGGTFAGNPDALLPSAPVGALIGKLGGSNVDCPPFVKENAAVMQPAQGPRLMGIGTHGIFDVKASESGPLYLTMNDRVSAFATHDGGLEVTIEIAIA
jgi:hypothetical protein